MRERRQDIPKMRMNPDPLLHPFEKTRELARALNSVKLERLFSKPFLGSLEGHVDGVYTLGKHYRVLNLLVSGSADGELRLWNLSEKKEKACIWNLKNAHSMFVKGVSFLHDKTDRFLSASNDATVRLWDIKEHHQGQTAEPYCVRKYLGDHPFSGIDHHYHKNIFATSGAAIEIWSQDRNTPIQTFEWGHDTLTTVKFNITETNILAACAHDRSIILYDLRLSTPISKVILAMRSNALAWNPMEAFNFTVANEDHNCYTFDMRNFKQSTNILKDHVSAVLDLDYSPTGEEIVTGAYDRSIRIFNSRSGHSREVYHTKRMQKVFCVKYSMDAKFILSGSDDGCIRVWRAEADQRLGYKNPRQKDSIKYSKALIKKYQEIPEIKRIAKHRRVPKPIISAQREKRIMEASQKRKEDNRLKHSKPRLTPIVKKREVPIVSIEN